LKNFSFSQKCENKGGFYGCVGIISLAKGPKLHNGISSRWSLPFGGVLVVVSGVGPWFL
jgi:hypothetical protein